MFSDEVLFIMSNFYYVKFSGKFSSHITNVEFVDVSTFLPNRSISSFSIYLKTNLNYHPTLNNENIWVIIFEFLLCPSMKFHNNCANNNDMTFMIRDRKMLRTSQYSNLSH